jgi:branched-chain amino acid transport system permease protein
MTIGPFMGGGFVMKAFVIVVLGGMGYVPGALAGGLILGMVESLGSSYFSPDFRDGYGFILLILVLLFRPKGLFGAKEII